MTTTDREGIDERRSQRLVPCKTAGAPSKQDLSRTGSHLEFNLPRPGRSRFRPSSVMRPATPPRGESSRGPRLDRSTAVSKLGTHYWEFSWETTSGQWSDSSMPVWGSELASF